MHAYSYLGRPSSINRNRYQQHHPSMESAPPIWQQRQTMSKLDHGMLSPHQRMNLAEDMNGINNGSPMRGAAAGVCSSLRIPPAMLGSSDSINRACPSGSIQAATQNSASELYDHSNINPTPQFVDHNDHARYSMLLPPGATTASGNGLQKRSSSGIVGGMAANEGPMICELIGKLGGSSSSNSFMSSAPGGPSPGSHVQRVDRGMDSLTAAVKFAGGAARMNHCWNPTTNASSAGGLEVPLSNVTGGGLSTVDHHPSKGELLSSLSNHAGAVTSHCLSTAFTADPGFAERAARFSSFSNGGGNSAAGQTFSSDSESVGPSRSTMRTGRSGVPQLCPRNSSCSLSSSLQQETICSVQQGRVISNDSVAASERQLQAPDSRTSTGREIQSDHSTIGALVDHDLVVNNEDDSSSLKQSNYALEVEWSPGDSKTLTRTVSGTTVSNFMGSPLSNGEEAGDESLLMNASIDAASSEQVNSAAGTADVCPSPGGRSVAPDISGKKRKPNFEESRPPNKHGGSGSALPHLDKDAKTTESEEARAKRMKRRDGKDDMRGKADRASSETSGESSPRPTKEALKASSTEHPKTDYIHVRARRGQATDSHSLAERVRREKISERMKFLQDLVPGCSKVTGKAVMLDEIINYVQSLQRQVEFLSMKLASVNPRLDYHHESFLAKEGPHGTVSQAMIADAETSIAYPPLQPKHRAPLRHGLEYQLHAEAAIRRSMSAMPSIVSAALPSVDSFEDGVQRQTMWDDGDSDLNSIVQMGFGHSQATSSQGLQCHLPPGGQVKEFDQSGRPALQRWWWHGHEAFKLGGLNSSSMAKD
ncbi:unnamed protein product [Calypogeia fissa]